MIVSLDVAIQAGQLAQAIKARQQKMLDVQAAIDAGWQVIAIAAHNPAVHSQEMEVNLDILDVPTSMQCLLFALQVYQVQIADLQTQLAAL